MTMEWSPEYARCPLTLLTVWLTPTSDDITFFKALIRCRPVGLHQSFRMVNLFLVMNPDLSSTIKFPMSKIKQRLSTFYDIDVIHERELEALTASHDDSDSDEEVNLRLDETNFELPYVEYRDLIEAHAIGEKDASGSSSQAASRDLPSLSQSTKAESPEDRVSDQDEEKPVAKRGRKRASTTTTKDKPTPKVKRTATASGSVNGSAGTGTPGKETDEEDSTAGSMTRGNNKKQRTAPSRKSSRKK